MATGTRAGRPWVTWARELHDPGDGTPLTAADVLKTVALAIGIAGTLYGSLGIGFASQNAMNTVWNIPYVHWPGFWTLLSWMYLGSQLVLWAAEINVVLRYRLWSRSVTQPPLTEADRQVFQRLAQMEVRHPEQEVSTSFTDAADEDPRDGAG